MKKIASFILVTFIISFPAWSKEYSESFTTDCYDASGKVIGRIEYIGKEEDNIITVNLKQYMYGVLQAEITDIFRVIEEKDVKWHSIKINFPTADFKFSFKNGNGDSLENAKLKIWLNGEVTNTTGKEWEGRKYANIRSEIREKGISNLMSELCWHLNSSKDPRLSYYSVYFSYLLWDFYMLNLGKYSLSAGIMGNERARPLHGDCFELYDICIGLCNDNYCGA